MVCWSKKCKIALNNTTKHSRDWDMLNLVKFAQGGLVLGLGRFAQLPKLPNKIKIGFVNLQLNARCKITV